MGYEPLLGHSSNTALTRRSATTTVLAPRRQFRDKPTPEEIEDLGPSMAEYLQILLRRKNILILIGSAVPVGLPAVYASSDPRVSSARFHRDPKPER